MDYYLPYILDYTNLQVDRVAIFCVALLVAILVSAEAQGFMATLLGDSQPGNRERMHFNVFLHLDILGTLSFFVAGFGWSKRVRINVDNFRSSPKLFLLISRLAGPVANLLLANIAASLNWILGNYGFEDEVFSTMVLVNATLAVYGLLPVPPLPGGVFLQILLPSGERGEKVWSLLMKVGPFLLLASFLAMRLSGWDSFVDLLNPLVEILTRFILVG